MSPGSVTWKRSTAAVTEQQGLGSPSVKLTPPFEAIKLPELLSLWTNHVDFGDGNTQQLKRFLFAENFKCPLNQKGVCGLGRHLRVSPPAFD